MTALESPIHPNLWVDARWSGENGIGRFSREVLARLGATNAITSGNPASPLDAVHLGRMKLSKDVLLFNPGYNAGLTRARQLLTLHDLMHLNSETSAPKRFYYEHVVKPAVKRCGAVLTVSETSRSLLADWLADPRVSVVNVGNGASFDLSDATRGAEPQPNRLLYVGNLKAHKNFNVVVAAMKRMSEKTLDVVTSDPEEATVQINAAGLGGRSRVLTAISDQQLSDLYRSAGAVILPSSEEGFGLPAIEALAHGVPVVYWEGCAALREVTGAFGYPVRDLQDSNEWASVARGASAGPRVSGADSREWLDRYTWESVANRVLGTISQLEQ